MKSFVLLHQNFSGRWGSTTGIFRKRVTKKSANYLRLPRQAEPISGMPQ